MFVYFVSGGGGSSFVVHIRFNLSRPEEGEVWSFIANVLGRVYPDTPVSKRIKLALYDYVRLIRGRSSILDSKLSYDRRMLETQLESLKREVERLRSELEECRRQKQELEDRIVQLEEELNRCRELGGSGASTSLNKMSRVLMRLGGR